MIYITGDVHVNNPQYWEQKGFGSNVQTSLRYLEILKRYKLSCTLFINGKCLDNEREEVRKLLNFDVEFGGHTYDNFGNLTKAKSYFYRKFFGCIYGSKRYQIKDIQKTKNSFENLGLKMISWRTHAFGSNEETFKLLKRLGVTHVSDFLGNQKPFRLNGIIHVPINIPVDQNTVAYGPLTPENKDVFASCTKGRILPEEWLDIVKKRIIKNEKDKIDSVLLLHPATMAYIDKFGLFEQLCKFLSKFKSAKISELRIP